MGVWPFVTLVTTFFINFPRRICISLNLCPKFFVTNDGGDFWSKAGRGGYEPKYYLYLNDEEKENKDNINSIKATRSYAASSVHKCEGVCYDGNRRGDGGREDHKQSVYASA